MADCIILTQAKYIVNSGSDWYIDQVLLEQLKISEALKQRGWTVLKKSWDDLEFNWSDVKFVLIREVWDYFNRFTEFEKAIHNIGLQTKIINPVAQVIWNTDKHYMLELQKKNVPIISSHFIEKTDERKLKEILSTLGWNDAVVKPAISGAAKNTYRLNKNSADEIDRILRNVRNREAFMLQPFMTSIMTQGEISLMIFGGKYSHAVIKLAKKGDFRVQDDWGGTVESYEPSKEEIDFTINAVNACEPLPVYARVDIVRDNSGDLVLGELELIEPELWFRMNDSAADLLAAAVVKSIG